MNLAVLLEMAAEGMAERVALGAAQAGLSFAALHAQARRAGAWIAAQPGKRLVLVGLNSPAVPLGLFGAALAGKPFCPLNYRLPDTDLRRILARTAPSTAIVDDNALGRVAGVAGVRLVARSEFLAMAADPAGDVIGESGSDAEAIAVMLFTSGTTGEPKAAVLRHRHLAAYVLGSVEFMGAGEHEAALVSVPPYHIAGISAAISNLYLGRRVIQLEGFAPEEWVRTARAQAVTHAMLVPTMLGRILDVLESDQSGLPDLRHIAYGGGRMAKATIERALARLPQVDFVNAYGLTETSSTIAVLHPQDHRTAFTSEDAAIRRRLGSVGQVLPGLELEIRDAAGTVLPPDVAGEIWVRGEQVSGEYLGQSGLDADGWFPTRDCGWLDADGYLYVDGRLDDIIVRGGENISPGEIEDVLRQHPAVRDAAVIGLPDDSWGECVVAVLVADVPPEDAALRAWVSARLRSTKAPARIIYRSELPYNETGKLLRRALRAELAGGSAT